MLENCLSYCVLILHLISSKIRLVRETNIKNTKCTVGIFTCKFKKKDISLKAKKLFYINYETTGASYIEKWWAIDIDTFCKPNSTGIWFKFCFLRSGEKGRFSTGTLKNIKIRLEAITMWSYRNKWVYVVLYGNQTKSTPILLMSRTKWHCSVKWQPLPFATSS